MSNVEKTRENMFKCLCMKKCPSYSFSCKVKNMPSNTLLVMSDMEKKVHAETFFCAYDKSTCIEEEKGCVCPECEVYKKYNLDKMYYCTEDGGK